MGRKGVSKRKPKKSISGSNDNININHGSSKARPGEGLSPVQALVNAKDAPPDRGRSIPAAGSNKKNRKGR
jgi:hypothetical protein